MASTTDKASGGKHGVADLGTITVAAVKDLRVAEDNPRRIPPRAVEIVALSLQRFGWQQPLVVDETNTILAGHTRLQAAKHLGLTQVPVVVARGLTEDEARAYRIADNRTHDFTTWDFPSLVDQLDGLAEDFSDVLALTDWEAVIAELENAEPANTDVDLPEQVKNTLDGFEVVVCFSSKEEALTAGPQLMDMPGVFDVRHKF
ncbi:ParB N-terminal domain-containing protein [Pseudonocardia sp. NPDC049635]|uniref:ParB N-terminal domain-containing protein n=1 Tax=Pseudonocardia sp. NPDC049635 TaxID=3155506 RepID=UPI0033C88CEE